MKLFSGYIADSTGSYAPAFYVAGSCILIGTSSFFMTYFLHKEAEEETETQTTLVVVEKVTAVWWDLTFTVNSPPGGVSPISAHQGVNTLNNFP